MRAFRMPEWVRSETTITTENITRAGIRTHTNTTASILLWNMPPFPWCVNLIPKYIKKGMRVLAADFFFFFFYKLPLIFLYFPIFIRTSSPHATERGWHTHACKIHNGDWRRIADTIQITFFFVYSFFSFFFVAAACSSRLGLSRNEKKQRRGRKTIEIERDFALWYAMLREGLLLALPTCFSPFPVNTPGWSRIWSMCFVIPSVYHCLISSSFPQKLFMTYLLRCALIRYPSLLYLPLTATPIHNYTTTDLHLLLLPL